MRTARDVCRRDPHRHDGVHGRSACGALRLRVLGEDETERLQQAHANAGNRFGGEVVRQTRRRFRPVEPQALRERDCRPHDLHELVPGGERTRGPAHLPVLDDERMPHDLVLHRVARLGGQDGERLVMGAGDANGVVETQVSRRHVGATQPSKEHARFFDQVEVARDAVERNRKIDRRRCQQNADPRALDLPANLARVEFREPELAHQRMQRLRRLGLELLRRSPGTRRAVRQIRHEENRPGDREHDDERRVAHKRRTTGCCFIRLRPVWRSCTVAQSQRSPFTSNAISSRGRRSEGACGGRR